MRESASAASRSTRYLINRLRYWSKWKSEPQRRLVDGRVRAIENPFVHPQRLRAMMWHSFPYQRRHHFPVPLDSSVTQRLHFDQSKSNRQSIEIAIFCMMAYIEQTQRFFLCRIINWLFRPLASYPSVVSFPVLHRLRRGPRNHLLG